jgi:opacity protein-like surface antigen
VNTIAKLSIVACGALVGTTAMAGGYYDHGRRGADEYSGAYIGLSVGEFRYQEDGLNDITPTVAMVRLGATLSPNLGIEARAGGSFGNALTDSYGLSVQSMYSGYLKGSLPLTPGFSLYGLGGIAAVNLQRDFGVGDSRDSGFSFGVGADFDLPRGPTLNIEWTRLPGGNNLGYDYRNDMASFGVVWHL